MSNTKAEYIATGSSAMQMVRLRRMLFELQYQQVKLTKIFCDSKDAIAMWKNPMFHGHSKHIEIKYHKICDLEKIKKSS